MMPEKIIICADAMDWLADNRPGAIVTSPPDAEEIGQDMDTWSGWFRAACLACFQASAGPVVFYVTDRKQGGRIYSKPAIIFDAAAKAGIAPAWHKIALRREVGKADIHRPGFSHLIAFGAAPGVATPDTFMRGRVLYPNGTGLVACRVACEWAGRFSKEIADPFCGRGTIPAVAEALGFGAVGVDIDPEQCERARGLSLRAR